MRILRYSLALAAIFIFGLLIAFVAYDYQAFQSRKQEILPLIVQAHADERALNPSMAKLLRLAENNQVPQNAGRILVAKLQVSPVSENSYGRIATIGLWWALAAIHLSEQEQLTLLASQSFMNQGRIGIAAEAQARFGRPLSSLSLEEEATIASLVFSPYVPTRTADLSPLRNENRRTWLLSKYKKDS
jgi:hypothetical protein